MAQKITVKELRGPLGKGERKFWAVVDSEGVEFTTFDSKIADLSPGDVLEIEPQLKPGKGGKTYANITDWKVLEKGQPGTAATPTNGKAPERSYTSDPAKNASIEAQTAAQITADLWQSGQIRDSDPLVDKLKKWCNAKMILVPTKAAAPVVTKAKPEAKPEESAGPDGEAPTAFENAGQFLTKCQEVFKLNRTQVLDHAMVKALFDAGDFGNAYLKLAELASKKAA